MSTMAASTPGSTTITAPVSVNTYSVSGTATRSGGTSAPFGPGSLRATVGSTGFTDGVLTLPPLTFSNYRLFGFLPTTVQAHVATTAPVTGTTAGGTLTVTSSVNLVIDQITTVGVPLLTPGSHVPDHDPLYRHPHRQRRGPAERWQPERRNLHRSEVHRVRPARFLHRAAAQRQRVGHPRRHHRHPRSSRHPVTQHGRPEDTSSSGCFGPGHHRPPWPTTAPRGAPARAALTAIGPGFAERNPGPCVAHGPRNVGGVRVCSAKPRAAGCRSGRVGAAFADGAFDFEGVLPGEAEAADEFLAGIGGPLSNRVADAPGQRGRSKTGRPRAACRDLAAVGADAEHHQAATPCPGRADCEVDAVDPDVDVVGAGQRTLVEPSGLVLPLDGEPGAGELLALPELIAVECLPSSWSWQRRG